MNKPRFSYRKPQAVKSGLGIKVSGNVVVKDRTGRVVASTHNLETNFLLERLTLLLSGEWSDGSNINNLLRANTIAFGTSTATVTAFDTTLQGEILRKNASVTRTGSSVAVSTILYPGEDMGTISCMGMYSQDFNTGTVGTGTIVLGGTPVVGDQIRVTLDGRGMPVYAATSADLSVVANGLANWLNNDSDFGNIYHCTVTGSTISISSYQKGTFYNAVVGVATTGGVTATATGISGSATAGGNLLAATNVSFVKTRDVELIVEWSISFSN